MIRVLEDVSIDGGAPAPKILASDTDLYLIFYSAEILSKKSFNSIERRDVINDEGVGLVMFENYQAFKFGVPGDEILESHPLFKVGLKYYKGQILDESPWVKELSEMNKVHPYHNSSKFLDHKHYIFTFHDSTFECIAQNYSLDYHKKSMYDVASMVLQHIVIKEV
jgi:hypothetical protein